MSSKSYDGSHAAPYTIRPGDSLSGIAQRYEFERWQPIWVYNHKVHHILGDDPNLIHAGTEIFIPRSRRGYDDLIRKLRSLSDGVGGDALRIVSKLEGSYSMHQANRVLLDAAGEAGKVFATVGASLFQMTRHLRTAAATRGSAKAAAAYLANEEARRLSKRLTGKLKDDAVNALLSKKDADLGSAYQDLYLTQRDGIDAIRGVSLKAGKSLLRRVHRRRYARGERVHDSGISNTHKAREYPCSQSGVVASH